MTLFPDDNPWVQVLDGNPDAKRLYDRHYSKRHYKDGRKPKLFVGPGEKLVLLSTCKQALFVWRKFISMDNQTGINCAVFRNESTHLSSFLIKEAMEVASKKWPGERLYTYVNPRKVRRKRDPGRCFIKAGWRHAGLTKGKLLIFEYP